MNTYEANAGEKLYSAICSKCGAEWIGPHANGPRRCYGDCGHAEFKCTEVNVHVVSASSQRPGAT